MSITRKEVVVIGAGQAGIATSEHLAAKGLDHVVLERDQIASRWRKERWDSLVANGPAWHDRFPNMRFTGDQERFAKKEEVADYFVNYVEKFDLPVREGVEVKRVTRKTSDHGFTVETSDGDYETEFIVAATGAFQVPVIPAVVPEEDGIFQMHSSSYHRPSEVPDGGVLVVGAGSSGVQIADELNDAGRTVYLAVGPHDRPPRSYRGRDYCWWLGVLDKWDMATPGSGAEHVTITVSGAKGGHTVDFRDLADRGITLAGRAGPYAHGVMKFADDVAINIHNGDENYLSLLREADLYVERNGLDLPEEPEAYELRDDPECVKSPIRSLDLKANGINSIVWATGFGRDYQWLDVAEATNHLGVPQHVRGVSAAHGVFFVGLPWQSRRGSSFIWGSWHDAKYVADQIGIQHMYMEYPSRDDQTIFS